MPGKLYQGQGEVVTPHIGDTQIHAMYLGSQYVGYDSRYSTFISASGGTIYDSGSFRYHLFTSSADFTVHSLPLSQFNSRMEFLVVGGGGGGAFGGPGFGIGGGNGGAVVHVPFNANYRINVGTYNVVIGSGGTRQINPTPASSGSASYFTGSNVELYALGGATPDTAFVSQSSLSGLSGTYGHNFPAGQPGPDSSPGGGGAGEVGGNGGITGCVGGVGGDGYLVETFPFSNDWDQRSVDKWGAGGGGTGYDCLGSYVGADGGESGGGKGKGATTPITIGELNGYPNTGGGGGGSAASFNNQAGNGATGYVALRYLIS